MSDDLRVDAKRNAEVRQAAKKLREYFRVESCERVDILDCLRHSEIWTLKGVKRLDYQVRPDFEMGENDATTTHSKGLVTIAAKQSVNLAMIVGDGRARNTLGHELGHAVMHDGVEMPRRTLGNKKYKSLEIYRSAEHQAKVFAPAFLINDDVAETLTSAEEVSVVFGISLQSAKIYYEQLVERRNRERTAEKFRHFLDEFRQSSRPVELNKHYFKELCSACGNRTLLPIGCKFLCQSCNRISDLQDGDSGTN